MCDRKYAYKNENSVIRTAFPTRSRGAVQLKRFWLYRQETIYACDNVDLDRRLMAQWMGKLGFELDILTDYILNEIEKAERIFADETTLPTLAPGSRSAKTAWL